MQTLLLLGVLLVLLGSRALTKSVELVLGHALGLRAVHAVSYTHLDVYKRQSRGRPEPRRATPIRRPVGRSAACAVQECLPAARRLRLPASP